MALAVLSQQYALLVALALVLTTPTMRQCREFLLAFGATFGALGGVIVASCGPQALRALITGTGSTFLRSDSLLAELGLSSSAALVIARCTPFVITALVCWWWRRHTLPASIEGLLLVVCAALASRLIVEENIWGYYFFPVTIGLALFDVLTQRLRVTTVLLLSALVLAFYPFRFGNDPLRWIAMWKWQVVLLPLVVVSIISALRSQRTLLEVS